jgi:uncharacterized protein (DUF697 family)
MTMNKKKLPKAIRRSDPGTSTAGAAPDVGAPVRKRRNMPSPDALPTSPEARRAAAQKLVERFSVWSGAAGLIPVPFVDLAAVGGVQIQMLRRLSQIYSVPFSKNRGKAFAASVAGAMIPASSGMGAASLIKSVPLVGTAISIVVMPTLSAGATYAIGMVFIEHFSSGGTFLDFNPAEYRALARAQKALWGTRSRAAAAAQKHPARTARLASGTTGAARR